MSSPKEEARGLDNQPGGQNDICDADFTKLTATGGAGESRPHIKPSDTPLLEMTFPVAIYPGYYETIPTRQEDFTFDELADFALNGGGPYLTEDKRRAPYFTGPMKSAPLVGKTREKAIAAGRTGDALIGAMRSKSHSLGGAVYKHDLDDVPEDEFKKSVKALAATGLACVVYTTFKHGTERGLVRARVLTFGDRVADPDEFAKVSEVIGLALLGRSYDASEHMTHQLAGVWMCPPDRAERAKKIVRKGALIDTDAALEAYGSLPGKGKAANAPEYRGDIDLSVNDALGSRGPFHISRNKAALKSALYELDPNSEPDWFSALKVAKGALNLPEASEDEKAWFWGMVIEWSRQSGKFVDEAQQRRKMDASQSEHPRTLFTRAKEKNPDWINPGEDREFTDPNFVGGEPEPEEAVSGEFPDPYPGFMADTVAAVVKAAHKPQPRLTTLAVLTAMASACDGRVSLPDGGRLNLYALGIAETAGGKEAPRSAAEDIARAVGARTIGGLASGQGLEDALPEAGAAFMGVDEIGHDLRNISQGKAPTHLVEAHKILLKLYTASNGVYQTREKAATKGNPKSRTLSNPCLNVLGFTTPSTLSSALSTESIESGLLGRFLFAVGDINVKQRLSLKERELDRTLMSALAGVNRNSGSGRQRITISEEIEASLQEMVDRIHDDQVATEDPIGRTLLGRTFEKVMRVAGILAFWDSIPTPKDETVSETLSQVFDEDGPALAEIKMRQAHLEWAERFVRVSNAALLQFAKDRIHDDEVQANAAKLVRLVSGIVSGKHKAANTRQRELIRKKLAPRQLCLNRSNFNATQFDIALKHAEAAGMLVSGEFKEEGQRTIGWLAIPQDY